ncbi:hypothetical protein Q4S45_16210 [Massilia sp. R2A-15]|uniref:hypothetical protein n=1 Tax=Massilia sp. R2A-15 TaxID=3064278 RepID=UPI0027371227|nr:hypothetical protein [Massilia sp. R2A-15]WLI88268.1 hypothetical protein Q4S45_16210 [Massilia sp. R2A-15]
MTFRQRFLSFIGAAWRRLDQASAWRFAMVAMPLVFGLMSLRLGQDDNWDLKNYHLYNPFALLNGKIGFDLAPAQWQSYFNPTLDLLYYGLTHALPGPVAGFVMGCLHGLNFVLAAAIARYALPHKGYRLPLLLALAGTLGAGFLTQLGNSMGDNTTSLLVLGAVLLVLSNFHRLARGGGGGAAPAIGAGIVMGLGAGLKLTNATYALALCLALFALPGNAWPRLRAAFVFGVGVLAGIAASAGHWYWKMWTVFGNPLFPQFNDRFHGPLAAPIGIGDTGWLPRGLAEKFLWPFIFALDSKRVGELKLTLLLWPALYAAFALLALTFLFRRPAAVADEAAPLQRMLLAFFALAYLGWLNLFGIYRYLIPLELIAPLALWLVLHRLAPPPLAARIGAAALVAATIAGLPHASWGHASWARAAFSAEVPAFPQPQESLVFTVHGDPPMGWLVTLFPKSLAFVSLGSGFPESQAYQDRVRAMVASRRGPLYVMLQADRADPAQPRSEADRRRAQEANRETLGKARDLLARYGFVLDQSSCRSHPAFIGRTRWAYQLCTVSAR